MLRNNRKQLTILVFLIISTVVTLAVFSEVQVWQKRAELGPAEVVFDSLPGNQLQRIWGNFSQGGEEKGLMLKPAESQIKTLQPQLIRIDHLFDFYEIIKRGPDGKLIFDFSNLDIRVDEIISLGATPFLSLSYYPSLISADPVGSPNSYQDWGNLIEKTIERYSGKNGKNLWGVYYEVWNEPDLFGKMDPSTYFTLYQTSAEAAQRCQSCNSFKVGGPAITTLKRDWMISFLNQVVSQRLRLDFISWHSYQMDPRKTLWETETIKSLGNFSNKELIISEWGSSPEVSSLHDSIFDACHAISAMALLSNSVDKVFTFELVDGSSPELKKYWGRWGILTHSTSGITPKPKYFSFLYLNKLLEFETNKTFASPYLSAIGSTDGKENYVIVACQPIISKKFGLLNFKFNKLPPGIYSTNIYSLLPNQNPLISVPSQASFNGGEFKLSLPATSNSIHLIELSRISPSLIKSTGRTDNPNDLSARVTSFVPPLVFPINFQTGSDELQIDFWFKDNWGKTDTLKHVLLENKDFTGKGFSAWIQNEDSTLILYFEISTDLSGKQEIKIPLPSWTANSWHHFTFRIDNPKMIFKVTLDQQEKTDNLKSEGPTAFDNYLYLGSDSKEENSAEGMIDSLIIHLNNQTLYEKDFDQTPVPAPE